ncbi:cold-responsive protein kinase 1-like [Arachis stenosperma]|uniref:cold-responsive protein kinase 1-like n=1 Tax=Arachis stenosperma TaxID=217475 RepID=UPI0025ABFA35|nr:cold-responsive protein kinase 1-like [Arachis stenosperma]
MHLRDDLETARVNYAELQGHLVGSVIAASENLMEQFRIVAPDADLTLVGLDNVVRDEDFSYSNKLGKGGFGSVYKGKLFNGQMIAVKRLSKDSGQGDMEFRNKEGAKVNISADGATPLHITANNDSLKIINCLLKARADPNVSDRHHKEVYLGNLKAYCMINNNSAERRSDRTVERQLHGSSEATAARRQWRRRVEVKGNQFLYDIVANGRNEINVDKFEYIVRDCRACGLSCNFPERLTETMQVIDDEICYRAKDC